MSRYPKRPWWTTVGRVWKLSLTRPNCHLFMKVHLGKGHLPARKFRPWSEMAVRPTWDNLQVSIQVQHSLPSRNLSWHWKKRHLHPIINDLSIENPDFPAMLDSRRVSAAKNPTSTVPNGLECEGRGNRISLGHRIRQNKGAAPDRPPEKIPPAGTRWCPETHQIWGTPSHHAFPCDQNYGMLMDFEVPHCLWNSPNQKSSWLNLHI